MKKTTVTLLFMLFSLALMAQDSPVDKRQVSEQAVKSFAAISHFKHLYNPVTNKLTLSADESLSHISLYNILGQRLLSKKLYSKKEVIQLTSLKTGIYLVNVQARGKLVSFKLVKR